MCGGVGWDSGCGHEESHLMHDIKIIPRKNCICMECEWIFVCHCMCIKVGSNPCRKIQLLGIAYPVVGK